ncbi:MAG: hypothetical protein K6T88_22745 [Bacillus sp. (in: Bacteria)]|nr:hypothetical protein [Bacillus sp. (in: firmicutes)]
MGKKENSLQFQSRDMENISDKDLYGLEPKNSLLSVRFAPNENSLLNEHFEEVDNNCDE